MSLYLNKDAEERLAGWRKEEAEESGADDTSRLQPQTHSIGKCLYFVFSFAEGSNVVGLVPSRYLHLHVHSHEDLWGQYCGPERAP